MCSKSLELILVLSDELLKVCRDYTHLYLIVLHESLVEVFQLSFVNCWFVSWLQFLLHK